MKHIGVFDANRDPLKPGGLSSEECQLLESRGWRKAKTKKLSQNVTVAFADPTLPGFTTLRKVDIPEGVEYYYNPEDGAVILKECGNPPGDDFEDIPDEEFPELPED